MYPVILATHIVGALGAGAFVAYAAALTMAGRTRMLTRAAPTMLVSLYALSAWQVVSGSLLALLSPQVSALGLCGNLALYLTVIGITLVALHRTVASHEFSPAFGYVRRAFGSSLGIFIGVLVLGF